jgi:hypothetical protein
MAAKPLPPLRLLMFLGSTRPNRLCARVSTFAKRALEARGHAVQAVDPLELQLPLLVQPHFAYAPGRAPAALEALARDIAAADVRGLVAGGWGDRLRGARGRQGRALWAPDPRTANRAPRPPSRPPAGPRALCNPGIQRPAPGPTLNPITQDPKPNFPKKNLNPWQPQTLGNPNPP